MEGFKEYLSERRAKSCRSFLEENRKKASDLDATLIREVLEKRIGMIYEKHATEQEIDELLDLALTSNKTTGQAIGWIFENFSEDGKFEPQDEKFAILADGRADEMTLEEIAELHGVRLDVLQNQLDMGREIEKEHTSDPDIAERIAMDHLVEIPDYYTRLKKMEAEAEAEIKKAKQEKQA